MSSHSRVGAPELVDQLCQSRRASTVTRAYWGLACGMDSPQNALTCYDRGLVLTASSGKHVFCHSSVPPRGESLCVATARTFLPRVNRGSGANCSYSGQQRAVRRNHRSESSCCPAQNSLTTSYRGRGGKSMARMDGRVDVSIHAVNQQGGTM